jgi:hypothetical protein
MTIGYRTIGTGSTAVPLTSGNFTHLEPAVASTGILVERGYQNFEPTQISGSNPPWSPLNMRSNSDHTQHTPGGSDNYSRASSPSLASETLETLSCQDCDKTFRGDYRKGNLGRHRRTQHCGGQLHVFACEDLQCQRRFRRKDALLKHYRRRHPELSGGPILSRKSGAANEHR